MKFNLSTKFLLSIGFLLTLCLGISFYTIDRHQEKIILRQAENEARVIFRQIIITRKWVADHGGIFVEKKPWVKPNRYLVQLGEESQTKDIKGRIFLKVNPAFVTRELSRYTKDEGLYWFKITSLKLVNPSNAPDEWERLALKEFEQSKKDDLITFQSIDGHRYLRFISPLFIEKSCLRCHEKQGYKVGDIRGALSITIPIEKTFVEISKNRKIMLIAALMTITLLIVILYSLITKLTLTPLKRLKIAMTGFSEGESPSIEFINTGDEIEDLAKAFSSMAEKLTKYHNCLHDRIRSTVKELEETNKKLLEMNRLLKETNERKSDFIARASHELRTPLTSIRGAIDYLSQKILKAGFNGDEQDFLNMIKRNTDRLINMVNDMLDIEKIEAGLEELQLRESNISSIITENIKSLRPQADEKNIRFSLHLEKFTNFYVDEEKLKQVFTNLISNAIRWSPEGSVILISSKRINGNIITEITDHGPGIKPEEQEKIFEKFYKKSKDGTGLGLTIAKSIIDAHGGRIGVKSNGLNGSTFYVELPSTSKN